MSDKKSKLSKVVEGFSLLVLTEQLEAFALIKGVLEQGLEVEKTRLADEASTVKELLENLKK